MLGEMHDVEHEFPDLQQTIRQLSASDAKFAALVERHDQLDREIRELEELGSPTTDTHMERLKYRRTELKDKIFLILRSA